MKIFDIHTHAFPDALAPRAIGSLARASGGLTPFTDGTAGSLDAFMKSQGVCGYAVLNIATNAHQMKKVNDFAATLKSDSVFPFGSVHPDAPDALAELERIKAMGLRGVKFHPDYQGFFADEDRMIPIYKIISELGLCVVFHAGQDYGFKAPFHCMPDNLIGALKHLDCPVIAAHWGGLNEGDRVLEKLCGLPLYFDISFGYASKPRLEALEIAEKHGTQRLLFGSDCPWHAPEMELRLLDTLDLSEDQRRDILWNNAARLLGFPLLEKEEGCENCKEAGKCR